MKTTTIIVPQVLRKVKNHKSVAEKVVFLSCLQGHPLHPFIMEGITKCCALACSKSITDKQMISYIDEMCELFADKFNK